MRFSWRSEWPHLLVLLVLFALAAASWAGSPDRIPVHWGLSGQPDRYGGRFEGLLLQPVLALGVYLLMLLMPRVDPGRANYPAFAHAYATLRLAVLVVLGAVQGLTLVAMHGRRVDMDTWMMLVLGGLLIVVGNLLGKVRPNWFVGVRTPWTLSSPRSWSRTHRLGGWLFIATGALTLACAGLRSPWGLVVMLGLLVATTLTLVVYSYVQWRDDPDRVPPAATTPE